MPDLEHDCALRPGRIADIRDTRNTHEDELKALSFDEKWDRCPPPLPPRAHALSAVTHHLQLLRSACPARRAASSTAVHRFVQLPARILCNTCMCQGTVVLQPMGSRAYQVHPAPRVMEV